MCDTNEKCLRAGPHPGVRHRLTMTKAERKAADLSARASHLSTAPTTKVGRYTLRTGDAVRLQQPKGCAKWLGVFSHLETNARSGITSAVVVGGKIGGSCLSRNVDPDRLVYLRPDSADARKARTFVAMSKVSMPKRRVG